MKRRALPVLPPMRCDDGCGDCCGPVPVTDAEFDAVARYAKDHNITPRLHPDRVTCPMYQEGRCAVYAVRPMICAAFGHIPKLPCARGYNRNVKAKDVDRAIQSGGPRTRLLHELLPDGIVADVAAWMAENMVAGGE